MKKLMAMFLSLAVLGLPLGAEDKKEADRLENCGTIIKEIMDIPDNIPQDLIDKAECIIVYPSVVKAAFVIGGSYGRGAMTCRSGEHFTGPWSAPTMMALEGASIGFQLGGQATDFVLLIQQSKTRRRCFGRRRPQGPQRRSLHRRHYARRSAHLLSRSRLVCRNFPRRFHGPPRQQRQRKGLRQKS